jgi:uncharacterized protein (PEP-CTERM system associated)
LALFEQEPRPLGMRAEFDRTYTRYDNTVRPLISDVARLGVNRSIDEQVEFGLHVGAENNNFVVGDSTSGVYGVDLRWRPSDRTNLAGFVEHRYFGTGGRIVFDHRMPWVAWNMLISRGITTTPQTLFTIGPTNDVTALLDQMYTTRFPDPLARARQVQQVMATAGLPAQLGQSTTVFTQRVSLESVASFRVAYLGERNSIALSASWTRLEDAPDTGPLATGLADNNNTQRLFALSVSRRLTRLLTGTISGGWNTIRSLPTTAAQQTTTETYGDARISALLSPRTSAYVGARHRRFDQDSSGNDNETAGFVGIDHRF